MILEQRELRKATSSFSSERNKETFSVKHRECFQTPFIRPLSSTIQPLGPTNSSHKKHQKSSQLAVQQNSNQKTHQRSGCLFIHENSSKASVQQYSNQKKHWRLGRLSVQQTSNQKKSDSGQTVKQNSNQTALRSLMGTFSSNHSRVLMKLQTLSNELSSVKTLCLKQNCKDFWASQQIKSLKIKINERKGAYCSGSMEYCVR